MDFKHKMLKQIFFRPVILLILAGHILLLAITLNYVARAYLSSDGILETETLQIIFIFRIFLIFISSSLIILWLIYKDKPNNFIDLLKNIILLIISLAITYLILLVIYDLLPSKTSGESLFIKSENPELIFKMKPNIEIKLGKEIFQTNSQGLRTKEYFRNNTNKIVFLGDSFTAGFKLAFNQSLPEIIQIRLFESNINREIINLATPAYNTHQEVELLRENIHIYKPNKVVLVYNANDAVKMTPDNYLYVLGIKRPPFYKFIYIMLISFLKNNLLPLQDSISVDNYDENSDGWLDVKASFYELKEIAQSKNFSVFVVFYPPMEELIKHKEYQKISQKVEELSKENNFHFFSLYSVFSKIDAKKLRVSKDDAHPSYEANNIATEALLDNSDFINFIKN